MRTNSRPDLIRALLKSIETGDPGPVAVVDEARYVQHNPQTQEGSEGLVALFQRLSQMSPRVNVVRMFEDGEFVFGHTEYDFSTRRIGFEVFRFDQDKAVEHWDNIQPRRGPNRSGRTMVDGPTEATDHHLTESNRQLVQGFVQSVLINGQESFGDYVDASSFHEHNPDRSDDLSEWRAILRDASTEQAGISYRLMHRTLAEGNFVLSMCQGFLDGKDAALFDLFRLDRGRIVEHWDTVEHIAPRSEWKNTNGKF